MRIEIHILQNFAPSNLNRDDTGSQGRRVRRSSPCPNQQPVPEAGCSAVLSSNTIDSGEPSRTPHETIARRSRAQSDRE